MQWMSRLFTSCFCNNRENSHVLTGWVPSLNAMQRWLSECGQIFKTRKLWNINWGIWGEILKELGGFNRKNIIAGKYDFPCDIAGELTVIFKTKSTTFCLWLHSYTPCEWCCEISKSWSYWSGFASASM